MEIRTETDYAAHHIQKFSVFSAMRAFAIDQKKHNVIYIHLNDDNNLQSFDKNIDFLIAENKFSHFEYQFPDEYRVDEHLKIFKDFRFHVQL
jgi:deoxyribodipyrimidine photolyase-related protein